MFGAAFLLLKKYLNPPGSVQTWHSFRSKPVSTKHVFSANWCRHAAVTQDSGGSTGSWPLKPCRSCYSSGNKRGNIDHVPVTHVFISLVFISLLNFIYIDIVL